MQTPHECAGARKRDLSNLRPKNDRHFELYGSGVANLRLRSRRDCRTTLSLRLGVGPLECQRRGACSRGPTSSPALSGSGERLYACSNDRVASSLQVNPHASSFELVPTNFDSPWSRSAALSALISPALRRTTESVLPRSLGVVDVASESVSEVKVFRLHIFQARLSRPLRFCIDS